MNAREDLVAERRRGALDVRLLGPVRVRHDAGEPIHLGGPKPETVLVRLALRAGEVVSTDSLVDTLWGDDPPPTARRSLQAHVAKLRAILGGDAGPIRSRPPGYVLDLPRACVDVLRIEDRLRDARNLLSSDPFRASELVAACRDEWTGEPLADLAGDGSLTAERERLVRLGDELADTEVELHVALGDPVNSILRLERAVADQPTHEPHWVRLITAYYASGRQQDALEAYRRACGTLLDQLGVDPSPLLRELEVQILRQELDPAADRAACPYKGLASYQIADGYVFYGRADTVDEVVALVSRASIGAVVGPSGVGKSSVLRAGLGHRVLTGQVPGIRSVAIITPGPNPLRSLYEAPPVDLVVVDQFEELFTLCDDEDRRAAFVDELVASAAAGRTRVVIGVRADFYVQCLAIPALVPVLSRDQVVVGAMSDGGIREAISGPARRAELTVEPALLDAAVEEVARHPGALPMLSHALRETWRRRTGSTLTLAAYRDAGSIAGAIATTAERLYDALGHDQRRRMQVMFRRLVEPGPGTQIGRRAAPRHELAQLGVDAELIDRLVAARLLATTTEEVEIAHEALIPAWPRLAGWIDEARDDIVVQQRLTRAAAAWLADGRDDADLYRGHKLAAALAWRRDARPTLAPDEEEFLRASQHSVDAESARRRRATRRLKTLTAVSLTALLAAVAASVVAVDRGRDADRRRRIAEADRVAALVAVDESLSLAERLSAAIALEARTPTAETSRLLLETLLTIPAATRSQLDIVAVVSEAPVYSNGTTVLVLDDHGRPAYVDAATLELERLPADLGPELVLVADDRVLAVSGDSFAVVDVSSGEAVGRPPQLEGEPSAVALSDDGATMALGYDAPSSAGRMSSSDAAADDAGSRAFVDLVDVATGATRTRLVSASSTIRDLEFAVGGRRVLGVADAVAVEVWDVASGRRLLRVDGDAADPSPVTTSAFGRGGDSLALGRRDGSIELWREHADGWRPIRPSREHSDAVTWLEFDAVDAVLVSSSLDGSAIVWETGDGTRRAGPLRFDAWGSLMSFFDDTTTDVVTIDSAGRVWTWPSAPGGALVELVGAASGSGPSGDADEWVGVVGGTAVVSHDRGLSPLDVDGPVLEVVNGWSGDVAVIFDDRLEWHRDGGELRLSIAGEFDRIVPLVALGRHTIAYTDPTERRRIVVRHEDGTILDEILVPFGLREPPARIDLDPNGTDLLYSTEDGELIWYALDGFGAAELLPVGRGHDGHFIGEHVALAVGSDGVQLVDFDGSTPEVRDLGIGRGALHVAVDEGRGLAATSGADGSLTLWDVDSRQQLASPLDVLGTESPRWIAFGGGDRLLVGGRTRTAVIDFGLDVACDVFERLGEERATVDAWYVGAELSGVEVCR